MKYWFVSGKIESDDIYPLYIHEVSEEIINEFDMSLYMASFETAYKENKQTVVMSDTIKKFYDTILYPCIYNKLKNNYMFGVFKTSDKITLSDMVKTLGNHKSLLMEADKKFKELL